MHIDFLEDDKKFLMVLKVQYFQERNRHKKKDIFTLSSSSWGVWRKQLKILTPNQILQRLPIAFAQVKAGNTSENLLNEIR